MLNYLASITWDEVHRLSTYLRQITSSVRQTSVPRVFRALDSEYRRLRGQRRLSLSTPFFATLGIAGILTFGQGFIIQPPDTEGAARRSMPNGSGDSLTEVGPFDAGMDMATEDRGSIPALARYVVQPGDTVSEIAASHGISATTIAWVNGLANPDHIQPGQVLQIMSVDGTVHRVRQGDTALKIAQGYGIPVEDLIAANQLGDDAIVRLSEVLIVPNAARGELEVEAHQRTQAARPVGTRSEQDFIASLVRPAQESQRITGVPASVTIAQAILETYWGTSFLAREANNYFGIKAHRKPGTAGVIWIDAWEVEDGRDVTRREPFRKYRSVTDSLVDHGRFFLENSRYARALEAKHDAREFARRIGAAGYATDPRYASKLIALMDRFNLQQYDL